MNNIYDHVDEIIAYVGQKVDKYEPNKFENNVKTLINWWCSKRGINVNNHDTNNFYTLFGDEILEIVKDNERRNEKEMERHRSHYWRKILGVFMMSTKENGKKYILKKRSQRWKHLVINWINLLLNT